MPPQSAPPAFGSQLSLGSSMHAPAPGQAIPAKPPQRTASAGGGQLVTRLLLVNWIVVPLWAANLMSTWGAVNVWVTAHPAPGETSSVTACSAFSERTSDRTLAS